MRYAIFLAVLALLVPPSESSAARPEEPGDASFSGALEVVEVQVPVHVVGRRGQPVRDLALEDFTLRDNGELQEILDLDRIDLELVQPGLARSEIERAVPPMARRRFLIVFDVSFSRPAAILKARRAAKRMVLEALHPTDLAAVVVLSADSGPRLVLTFTPDRAQLARAIDTLGYPPLLGGARWDPLRFVLDTPGAGTAAAGDVESELGALGSPDAMLMKFLAFGAEQVSRMDRSFRRGQVENWAQGMEELARSLHQVRGRKQVLFFSEGFDGRLLTGQQGVSTPSVAYRGMAPIQRDARGILDPDSVYGNLPLRNMIQAALEEFRRSDSIIQAIDISGLEAAAGQAQRSRQEALFFVANETGGELFEDVNNLGSELAKVLERTSVTYLLRYAPILVADGSYHRLELEARLAAGAELSYRAGYYAPRPYATLHPFERSLLAADAVAGVAPREDLDLAVLAVPFRAGGNASYVPVIVEAAGESLVAGHSEGPLPVEIYAYVSDERGEMRDFFTQALTLDLAGRGDSFADAGLKYYGHLELAEPGEYLLRVVVRNAATGRTGVRTTILNVPDVPEGEPHLLPALFMGPDPPTRVTGGQPRRWILAREAPPEGTDPRSVVYPYTVDGHPYVPAAHPRLASGRPTRLCLVAYDLPSGELRLTPTVTSEEGAELPGGTLRLLERTITGLDGVDKLLVHFTPPDLPPGNYHLAINTDPRIAPSPGAPFEIVE